MHGETNPVTLKGEITATVTDPWGNPRTALAVNAKINRKDWGLKWNQALEAGGWAVGEEVKLSVEFEAVSAKAEVPAGV
jgi:polyisoprenoid-binding protein YceI